MIDSVMEIFQIGPNGEPITYKIEPEGFECFQDAACYDDSFYSPISGVKEAIAKVQMVSSKDGGHYWCSGGMINNTAADFKPYLLTASHCIHDQEEASSVIAIFDYINTSCAGSPVDYSLLPKVYGATFLVSNPNTDSSLLRLTNNPSGQVNFLGWNVNPIGAGTSLYRLSHPYIDSTPTMMFSKTISVNPSTNPMDLPPTNFVYSTLQVGSIWKGSSGSPVLKENGQIVGQLLGAWPAEPWEDDTCSPDFYTIDGRFSEFYPKVAQYLNPTTPPPGGPCVPDNNTLCLNQDRFKVQVSWRAQDGRSGFGKAVPYGSDDSGMFWFFSSGNWEMLIKVLNGCSNNSRYWVFFAATTDQEFTVTVTDTQTGQVKQYFNPLKNKANAVTDTSAFATCP